MKIRMIEDTVGNTNNQRERLWEIVRILWENTSEGIEEPVAIPLATINDKLAEKGIQPNRETVYKDLNFLCDYMGVEKHRGKPMKYSLSNHFFNVEELLLLSVAAASSPFLTDSSRRDIAAKLASLDAKEVTTNLCSNIQVDAAEGTQQANTFYALMNLQSILRDPLSKRRDVSFIYKRSFADKGQEIRNSGKPYRVFPIRIMYANDFFYLFAYDYIKKRSVIFFRIDGMFEVQETEREQPWTKEQDKEIHALNDLKYDIRAFDMFWGEIKQITLEVPDKMMQGIVDRFGSNYEIVNNHGGSVTVLVRAIMTPPFFGWLCTYGVNKKKGEPDGPGIQLVGPPAAVKAYKDYLKQVVGFCPAG